MGVVSSVRDVVTASVLLVVVAVGCMTIVSEVNKLSLGDSAKLEVSSTIVSVGEGAVVVVSTAVVKD